MSKLKTREQRILEFNIVHGNKYDYSLVKEDVKRLSIITVICPVHGEFTQRLSDHMKTKGCKKCSHIELSDKFTKSVSEYLKDFNSRHNSKYDYPLEFLPNKILNKTKINIVCPEHGEFIQTVNNHSNGAGCPKCGSLARSSKRRLTAKQWEDKFNKVHFGEYKYNINTWDSVLTIYSYIPIECSIHGVFNQMINHHRDGSGCPECAGYNHKYAYIHNVNDNCLKFGITNNPSKRLARQNNINKLKITCLGVWFFPTVEACKSAERVVMNTVNKVMNKCDMPDGYTETCSFSHLDFIISVYNEHGGIKR